MYTDEYQIEMSFPDDLSIFTQYCCKQSLHLFTWQILELTNEHKTKQ